MRRAAVSLVLCVVGAGLIIWSLQSFELRNRSTGWPSTEGEIVSSEMEPDGVNLLYEYEVGGEAFLSSRVSLFDGATADDPDWLLERYPEETRVEVFYDPYDPQQAMLRRGGAAHLYAALAIGLFVTLIACAGVLAGVWDAIDRRRRGRNARQEDGGEGPPPAGPRRPAEPRRN